MIVAASTGPVPAAPVADTAPAEVAALLAAAPTVSFAEVFAAMVNSAHPEAQPAKPLVAPAIEDAASELVPDSDGDVESSDQDAGMMATAIAAPPHPLPHSSLPPQTQLQSQSPSIPKSVPVMVQENRDAQQASQPAAQLPPPPQQSRAEPEPRSARPESAPADQPAQPAIGMVSGDTTQQPGTAAVRKSIFASLNRMTAETAPIPAQQPVPVANQPLAVPVDTALAADPVEVTPRSGQGSELVSAEKPPTPSHAATPVPVASTGWVSQVAATLSSFLTNESQGSTTPDQDADVPVELTVDAEPSSGLVRQQPPPPASKADAAGREVAAPAAVRAITEPPSSPTQARFVTLPFVAPDGGIGRLRVSVMGDQVRATMLVEPHAVATLEHGLPELRRSLEAKGYGDAQLAVRSTGNDAQPVISAVPRSDQAGTDQSGREPGDRRAEHPDQRREDPRERRRNPQEEAPE